MRWDSRKRIVSVILVISIMIISICNSIISDNEIEQNKTKMYQLGGGGGSIEER